MTLSPNDATPRDATPHETAKSARIPIIICDQVPLHDSGRLFFSGDGECPFCHKPISEHERAVE